MKKIIIATFLSLSVVSSVWAGQTVDAHSQVNNAQAAAHQLSLSAQPSATAGNAMTMMEMNEHQRAIVAHTSMNNSQAYTHQQEIEKHREMMAPQ